MDIKVQTYDIAAALATVSRAIPNRPVRPIMDGVLLKASGNDLILTATTGDMTIETTITAFVAEEGSAVITGKLLTDLSKKLPAMETNITTDSKTAKIRSGSSRTNLAVRDAAEFPSVDTVDVKRTIRIPASKLDDMINAVAFSASTDESRIMLTGINVTVEDGKLGMVALDGFRLAMAVDMGDHVGNYSVVVPGNAMRELSKALPSSNAECVLGFSDGKMVAKINDTTLTSVLLAGQYTDYKRIIPEGFKTTVLVSRADILSAIDRAGLMSRNAHNNLIMLNIGDNSLSVTARDEIGEVDEQLEAQVMGPALTIAFNGKYLTDAFKSVTADSVLMRFNTATSPCVIDTDTGAERFLILPVRVA